MSVRFVPDAATEMTELLAQRADWIWNINPDQLEPVNKMPHLQAVRQELMRIGYLSIDAAGRTGAGNPLTKLKVRQAIWHAINRQEIADKLVTGGSRVPPAPCFPTQFGCDADAAVKYDYDPAKAKQLLAEAGYPDGFDVELASYVLPHLGLGGPELPARGRHPRQAQPAPGRRPLIQRAKAGEAPLVSRQLGQLFDQRRLGDPADLLRRRRRRLRARSRARETGCSQGGSSIDPEVRKKAYSAAIKLITEQAYWAAAAHLCDDLRVTPRSSTSRPTPTSCRASIWRSGSKAGPHLRSFVMCTARGFGPATECGTNVTKNLRLRSRFASHGAGLFSA